MNPRRSANSTVTSATSPPSGLGRVGQQGGGHVGRHVLAAPARAGGTAGRSPARWTAGWPGPSSHRSRSAKAPATGARPAPRPPGLDVSGRTSLPPSPSVSSTGSSDFSAAPHGSPPSSAGCSPSPSSSGQPSARIEDGNTSCSPSTRPTRSTSGRSAWLVSSTPRSSSSRSSRITRASAPTPTRARRRWICSRSATSASAARSSTWAWPSVRSKRSARSATTRPTGRAPLPWGACMASTSASRATECSRRICPIVSWR